MPPDPTFTPFTLQHGITVLIGIGFLIAITISGKRSSQWERLTSTALAFIHLAIIGFSYWAWSQVERESDLSATIPLQLCDLASICAGFALITRHRLLILLTYFWGLAGTIQGIVTPALDIGFPHPVFFTFFIQHFAIIGTAIYFPIVHHWRPDGKWWRAPLIAFAWINIYLAVALVANALLNTNFGFVSHKPTNPSLLDHLGPYPIYLIWLELIALTLFFILNLPLRFKHYTPDKNN